jgi:hypothetical protein
MESDNYTRLTNILAGISCCPNPGAKEEAYKTLIDMLWQVIPAEKEKDLFKMIEVKEVEEMAEKWYRD